MRSRSEAPAKDAPAAPDLEAIIHTAVRDALRIELRTDTAEYMDTRAAADYLGVSYQFLTIGRHKRTGPPYIKLASAIRYKRSDLDAWMAARRRAPEAA